MHLICNLCNKLLSEKEVKFIYETTLLHKICLKCAQKKVLQELKSCLTFIRAVKPKGKMYRAEMRLLIMHIEELKTLNPALDLREFEEFIMLENV